MIPTQYASASPPCNASNKRYVNDNDGGPYDVSNDRLLNGERGTGLRTDSHDDGFSNYFSGYYHMPREVFYPSETPSNYSHIVCDGTGEDALCADRCSWDILGDCTSVSDHLHYLNV